MIDYIIEVIKEFCETYGLVYTDSYSNSDDTDNCIGVFCEEPLSMLCKLFAYIVDYEGEGSIGHKIYQILGEPKSDFGGDCMILYFPKLKVKQEKKTLN